MNTAAVIAQLRERIAAGETYQVNYTFRLRQPAGDPWTLFAQLIDAQAARLRGLHRDGTFRRLLGLAGIVL